ncbi:type II secretion system protein N [Ectothiorhodospiraceae bacterium WFHF3C12]|nr:type II secretion system protein N [Ectothiorhodospiraceae bacterium WFHF3C12]
MMRWIGLTLIGIVAYLGFLVAHLPAAAAYGWVEDQLPARAYGLDGTIWDGRAAAIVDGPRRVDDVAWRIRPWSLLTGTLSTSLEAHIPDGRISGRFDIGINNTLRVRDLRLNAPVDTLLGWAGRGAMTSTAAGRGEVLLRSAYVDGPRLMSADGIINWNNAAITFGGEIPLGNMALRLQPADQGIRGELVTQGGVMDISGTMQLDPSGTFQIRGRIAARDPDNAQAQRLISMLQLANPDGVTEVTITGNLDGSGMRVRQRSG